MPVNNNNIDLVNKPPHYIPEDPVYECVKVAEAWGLDWDAYLYNVLKYICRAGKKDSAKLIEDLKKALWYLQRRIARLEGTNNISALPKLDRQMEQQLMEELWRNKFNCGGRCLAG